MGTIVIIIILLVLLSFALKLTFLRTWIQVIICCLAAIFIGLSTECATEQSKTLIDHWLSSQQVMFNIAALLTVDAAIQFVFCVLKAKQLVKSNLSIRTNIVLHIVGTLPNLMLIPVLFALHVKAIFLYPGANFYVISSIMAIILIIGPPTITHFLSYIIDNSDTRLELMFLVNGMIAALGIIATVNGATAAIGTNSVNWMSLAAVVGLILVGSAIGYTSNHYLTHRRFHNTNAIH